MRRLLLVTTLLMCAVCSFSQAVVTDPTSMAQRAALFLEQMEEALTQSLKLTENSENTQRLFQLTQESIDKLKKVSQFIETSKQVANIVDAELRISSKVKDYVERVSQISGLTTNEKMNVAASLLNLGTAAAERIADGLETARNNSSSDAQLSDYERLQIISKVEDEVMSLEEAIDEAYNLSVSSASVGGIIGTIQNWSGKAASFAF